MSDPLRPQRFSEYIGQPQLIARLKVITDAAKSRGEPIPHQLLSGPPGLGKTTLAMILANEIGANAHVIIGPAIEKPQDLWSVLTRLMPNDVLFIDEIHRMPPPIAEVMYPVMEDRVLHAVIDCKAYSRTVALPLPPFTLIGATTHPGLLLQPLRDRFSLPLSLNFYRPADLAVIIKANAKKLGIDIECDAVQLLSGRARGTPRIANHLLRFARDFSGSTIDRPQMDQALALQGIDHEGLNDQDRDVLRLIIERYDGGPVGIAAISSTMGLTQDTVSSVIEPFLLMAGFINRTPRGRTATDKARQHLSVAHEPAML